MGWEGPKESGDHSASLLASLAAGMGQAWRTHPEGTLGHVDASPGNDDGMLDGFGGHVGAAEGAVAIGDHFDVDGAAICILWASHKQGF